MVCHSAKDENSKSLEESNFKERDCNEDGNDKSQDQRYFKQREENRSVSLYADGKKGKNCKSREESYFKQRCKIKKEVFRFLQMVTKEWKR